MYMKKNKINFADVKLLVLCNRSNNKKKLKIKIVKKYARKTVKKNNLVTLNIYKVPKYY